MDIQAYISSGILEAYALDTLSSNERREVEEAMVKHPELRAELELIEKSLEDVAQKTAIKAPTDLKGSILDAIEDTPEETKVVPMPAPEQSSGTWRYFVAASVSLALVSGYLAFDYRAKWKSANEAYADLMASNTLMAEQYDQVNNKLESIENDFNILSNSEFQRVNLAGTENAQTASASVFWNNRTEELYLNIQNLQTLAQDQQYQLWAIVDGQPVDAGVFDLDTEGLIKMKNISGAAAFAVTIEKRGGSPSPSLETMQVIGNVG